MNALTSQLSKFTIANKGARAGGANTNKSGKHFEAVTDVTPFLLNQGFEKVSMTKSKFGFYLRKKCDTKTIIFVTQQGLRMYCKNEYNVTLHRCPDEAFIIHDTLESTDPPHTPCTTIKIIEKKNQTSTGSVDTKLYAAPCFITEYKECLGPNFQVEYAFCLNDFFKATSYQTMFKVLQKHSIPVFFGEDEDYFSKLCTWVGLPHETQ